MKIKTIHPDNHNLAKVTERFRAFADTRRIPYDEAQIEAMLLWIGSDATTWLTPEEWAELAPELERIQARNPPSPGSSGKEPAP